MSNHVKGDAKLNPHKATAVALRVLVTFDSGPKVDISLIAPWSYGKRMIR
jgi:hypothetical protein